MYSVLDIETTGAHALQNHITEISIINFDGEKITEQFSTLLKPESNIPFYISKFTGITQAMVADAPTFKEVADQIEELTKDKIIIAHNAHFDYTFLKQAFQQIGKSFNRKTLCTLRASRKIIPGMKSYSLDLLCRQLKIEATVAHRAGDDAHAALQLFLHLKKVDAAGTLDAMLKMKMKEAQFPPHLQQEEILKLPQEPGVYYFIDQNEKVLYVGKAKNLRSRVRGHFTSNSETHVKTKLVNAIHHINFQLAGNELVAMLMESAEIKKHFPPFNVIQKIAGNNFGLFCYEDGKGYNRYGIKKLVASNQPLVSFSSVQEARSFLKEKVREYKLCSKLCGLQKSTGACFDHEAGLCDGACCGKIPVKKYNRRVAKAIASLKTEARTFAIIGEGRAKDESSVIAMEDGKYLGFGFTLKKNLRNNFQRCKKFIEHKRDNREVQWIINSYLLRNNNYELIFG